MSRYQRSRLSPIQNSRKERINRFILLCLVMILLFWMLEILRSDGEEDGIPSANQEHEFLHDDTGYRPIRKAVAQDYDQPEKNGDYGSFGSQRDQEWTKLVELLLTAEPKQISDYATRELLPTWVKLYFEWYREQPVDSNQLVVKDLNYLDAAVYAAANMNRLLKLDIDETAMVESSLALDWKLPNLPIAIKAINTWDDRETPDSVVFGSTEFLQSVTVETARNNDSSLSASLFGALWHSMFQPSPLLLHVLRNNLDKSTLTPNHFAAVHFRYGLDPTEKEEIFLKGKRAIRCGQWALKQAHQDFVDLYFISNNQDLNDHVRNEGIDLLLSPNGNERIVVTETAAYQSRHAQVNTQGKSIHNGWWIDLYIAMVARCMVHGEGDFGEIASKISNTDCQVRHEETQFGTAPLCPPDS